MRGEATTRGGGARAGELLPGSSAANDGAGGDREAGGHGATRGNETGKEALGEERNRDEGLGRTTTRGGDRGSRALGAVR